MHLLERYALTVGNRIKEPYVNPHYFPINGRYIVFCGSKIKYEHWAVVNLFCSNRLKENGFTTIQIGNKKDDNFRCDLDLRGKLNFNHAQFIIKNAQAFVGEAGLFSHIAGHFNIPSVVVFGSPLVKINKPFWQSKKTKLIAPRLKKGFYHAFSKKKQTEYANTIPPEKIQNDILNILGIEKETFETISCGNRYKSPVTDIDPKKIPAYIPAGHINIRADKGYDLKILNAILQSKKCELTLSEPIKIDGKSMSGISSLNYISDTFDKEFVERLKSYGVKYTLLCTNKKNLSEERFKLFDEEIFLWDVEDHIKKAKKKHRFDISNVNMVSQKKIISGSSEYLTWFSLTEKEEDFWLDLDWLFVYV